jgi:aminoglycoside phosphotransferase (APT) family kinase protein
VEVSLTDTTGDVVQRLADFIEAVEPCATGIRISGLERSDIGYSRENWIFDAEWHQAGTPQHHRLIMRRDPTGSVLTTNRRTEYAVLKALESTTVPSPRARWLDPDGEWFGRPSLVMDRIAGQCRMFAIEGPEPLEQRLELAQECLLLLSIVHGLDWQSLGLGEVLGADGHGGATTEVDRWTTEMRVQQMEEDTRLDELARWLGECAPRPQTQVLVHGDFKPGNMLLHDGRIVGLLDWETAHIGDPVEDLGWVTNPLRRREHQIPGVWETAQIVARYQQLTGRTVGMDELRYWNVFANFKLAVIVLTGMRSYAEGRSDRPYDFPSPLIDLAFHLIEGGRNR